MEQSSTSMVQLDCAPSQQLALGLVAARQTSPPAPPPRRGKTTRFRSSAHQRQEAGTSSREGGHPRVANSMGITGSSIHHRLLGSSFVKVSWVPVKQAPISPTDLNLLQRHDLPHGEVVRKFKCCLAGAWRSRYDEYAVSGWLALNRMRNTLDRCWGLTLSSIPTLEGDGWALCIGRYISCAGFAGV